MDILCVLIPHCIIYHIFPPSCHFTRLQKFFFHRIVKKKIFKHQFSSGIHQQSNSLVRLPEFTSIYSTMGRSARFASIRRDNTSSNPYNFIERISHVALSRSSSFTSSNSSTSSNYNYVEQGRRKSVAPARAVPKGFIDEEPGLIFQIGFGKLESPYVVRSIRLAHSANNDMIELRSPCSSSSTSSDEGHVPYVFSYPPQPTVPVLSTETTYSQLPARPSRNAVKKKSSFDSDIAENNIINSFADDQNRSGYSRPTRATTSRRKPVY